MIKRYFPFCKCSMTLELRYYSKRALFVVPCPSLSNKTNNNFSSMFQDIDIHKAFTHF